MKSLTRKRVAITGMGAVTPLGHNFTETWKSVKSGKTSAAKIERFKTGEMPTKFACEVRNFTADQTDLTENDKSTLSYIGEFAYGASQEALRQAGLWQDNTYSSFEKSLILGIRPASPNYDWYYKHFITNDYSQADMIHYSTYNQIQTLNLIARSFNASGGNTAVQTACASSGQSIGEAYEQIAMGERKWS